MEWLTYDVILSIFLIFVRVSGVIMTAPFFSNTAHPVQVKLYLSIVTTILLFNVIPAQGAFVSAEDGIIVIFTAIIVEALVGIAMGLIGQLVFAGLEMGGALISINTGLSFANVVDSSTQRQSMILSNIFTMVAILVFLSIDGDKIYITALAKSYQVVPAAEANIHLAGMYFLEVATYLFIVGVQLSSPFLITIFLLDVSLGIFARIMPQANMMFIALPIKFGVGIAMLMLVIPYLPAAFDMIFQNLFSFLEQLLANIRPFVN